METWLTYNNKQGIKTDFYLETAFRKRGIIEQKVLTTTIELLKQSTHVPGQPYDKITKSGDLTEIKRSVKDRLDKFPYLGLTDLIFSNELTTNKKKSRFYPYVSIHYSDVRSIITTTQHKWEPVTIFEVFANEPSKDDYPIVLFILDNLELIKEFYFKGLDYDEFKYEILERFRNAKLNISAITKNNFINTIDKISILTSIRNGKKYYKSVIQLQKLDSETANKITNFIINEFDITSHKARENLDFKILLGGNNIFVALNAYIMDIYTLSRMLRFGDAQQIISYTGDLHTETYVNFFHNIMGYELIEKNIGSVEYKRCIHSNYLGSLI